MKNNKKEKKKPLMIEFWNFGSPTSFCGWSGASLPHFEQFSF